MGKIDLKSQHPGKPWMWKKEWAAGEIPDQTGGKALGLWMVAAFWNAIAIPGSIAGVNEVRRDGNHVAWLALLFPLVGLGLLIAAVRLTIRRRKFGKSVFKLATVPASPGGAVLGTVHVPSALSSASEISLRVACVHRHTTGSGKNRRTDETVLWEEKQIEKQIVTRGMSGSDVPVKFELPNSVPTTDNADSDDERVWRLEVSAAVSGIDYASTFDFPVFAVDPADRQPVRSARPSEEIVVLAKLDEPGVTATKRIDGGWDFHFSADRNIRLLIVLIVATLMMCGTTVIFSFVGINQVRAGGIVIGMGLVTLFFALVGGLVTLVMLLVIWQSMNEEAFVTVARKILFVRNTAPLNRIDREIPAERLRDIRYAIEGNAGSKVYYSIYVDPVEDKSFRVTSGIGSKQNAQWLTQQMKLSLGLMMPQPDA